MNIEIAPMQTCHIEAAAALVANNYRELRRGIPQLPGCYEKPETIANLLAEIEPGTPGAVALQGGRLIGFLNGFIVPQLFGRRAFYSPEWANGAVQGQSQAIYDLLYHFSAPAWIAEGCQAHSLSLMAHDQAAWQGWYWLGFGMTNVDGLRRLEAIPQAETSLKIRQATQEDSPLVAKMLEGLLRHLAGPAAFYRHTMQPASEQLASPDQRFWIASSGGEPAGLMGLYTHYEGACRILQDKDTIQLEPAYVCPEKRGRGVASTLLNHCLAVARQEGFKRCAIDFETANIQARRTWMRYFEPVCYSMVRFIDESFLLSGGEGSKTA